MEDLNQIFITNKTTLDTSDKRIQNIVNANLDDLKTKDWALNYWNWKSNKALIDYFQSDSYKIEAMYFWEAQMKMISGLVKFKIDAIDVYKKIEKVIDRKKEIPDYISYSINNPEVLNLFSGTYLMYKVEKPEEILPEEFSFSVEDNQLLWNYIYKDKYGNEKHDFPLFWHKDSLFLYYNHQGIWKFETTEGGDVFFTQRQFGQNDKYIKKTKD